MGGILLKVVWRLMPTTALLCLASLLAYLGFRFHCLIEAQWKLTRDPQSLGMAWFFFVIELLTLLPNTLPYTLRALALHMPNRKKDVLVGDDVPSVDILITCCNEDLDVILDTARAACVLDYPQDRYRIFVCDDGGSPTVKAAILDMRETYPHIYYTARVKGPVKDYKAGNLNHGLRYSRMTPRFHHQSYSPFMEKPEATLKSNINVRESVCPPLHSPGFTDWLRRKFAMHDMVNSSEDSLLFKKPMAMHEVREISSCSSLQSSDKSIDSDSAHSDGAGSTISEYVAGLDADMIPEPQWLRTMLPHLIDEAKMALVCPPQTFYDLPVNDPLTQTMSHFAAITEVVNDALGHADCLGSGYVARRVALESINGFPVESLSEDVCCSATMLGAGWKTGFVHETLQYGSVPESFFAHVKQRTRWFVGHVQTAFLFNFRLWGHRGRHLTILQRLAGMAFDLRQLVQIPIAFSYISIPFALLAGYPMVIWTSEGQLVWLIRLVTIWMLCHWSHQGTMGLLAGIGNGWYDPRAPSYDAELEQWMGPYILSAFFRSFILPKRFGGRATGFTASGSITSSLQERSAANRAPFVRRAYVTLFHHRVIIHVMFVFTCLIGVGLCIARVVTKGAVRGAYDVLIVSNLDQFVYVVTRIGWPPLLWLQNVISAMGPILYLINPPTTPDREDLLERDPKTGVAHPKAEYRVQLRKDAWSAWRYMRNCLAVVYTVLLIGLSTWL